MGNAAFNSRVNDRLIGRNDWRGQLDFAGAQRDGRQKLN